MPGCENIHVVMTVQHYIRLSVIYGSVYSMPSESGNAGN